MVAVPKRMIDVIWADFDIDCILSLIFFLIRGFIMNHISMQKTSCRTCAGTLFLQETT